VVCERGLDSALAERRAAAARAGLCIDLTAEADPAEVAAAGELTKMGCDGVAV
jgi:hypothetical protein